MSLPTVTNNSPTAGFIAWSSFHIVYNGVDYTVASGNTNLAYTWWQYNAGSPTTVSSNTFPTTLTADDQILFLNKSGIGVYAGNTVIIDGSLIVPQSILVGALAANSVQTTNLQAGSVTAAKMAIGDFTNYLEDAGFANTIGVSWIVTAGTNWTIATAGLTNIDKYLSKAGGTTGQVLNNLVLLVRPGDFLNVSGLSFNLASAGVKVGVAYYTNTGSFLSKDQLTLAGTQGAWTTFSYNAPVVPASAFYAVFVWEHDGVGTSRLANPTFRRRLTGSLIVDGAIDGQTITGALFQTSATAARGIKMDTTSGFVAYNTSGVTQFSVDPSTGALTGAGTITGPTFRTASSGKRVELNSTNYDQILGYTGDANESVSGSVQFGALVTVNSHDLFTFLGSPKANAAGQQSYLQLDSFYDTGTTLKDSKATLTANKINLLGIGGADATMNFLGNVTISGTGNLTVGGVGSGAGFDTWQVIGPTAGVMNITTTHTDIPQITQSISSPGTSAVYLVRVYAWMSAASAAQNAAIELFVDGVAHSSGLWAISGNPTTSTVSQEWRVTGLSAGSHTLKCRAWVSAGTGGIGQNQAALVIERKA